MKKITIFDKAVRSEIKNSLSSAIFYLESVIIEFKKINNWIDEVNEYESKKKNKLQREDKK
ncbi:MAG: hypothetical protein ABIM64_04090 [candidate division WOR-3 bacterium]